MKKWIYRALLFSIMLVFVTACSKEESDTNSKTEEQPYIKVENNSGVSNEVIDTKKQQRVWEIVDEAVWKKEDVVKTETAHYTFVAADKNPNISLKVVLYEMWITENNKNVELRKSGAEYTQLKEAESEELYELLTNEKLASFE